MLGKWTVKRIKVSQHTQAQGKDRITIEFTAFFTMPRKVPINKSFLYLNQSCSNLNYALPDMSTTTPENFRQNGAGTWEEIDYIQTDRPQEFYPLCHIHALCTQSHFSHFSYPSHLLRSGLGLSPRMLCILANY